MLARSIVAGLLVTGLALPAAAQAPPPATRADVLRQEREEKAQKLYPNSPDGLQRALNLIENPSIFSLTRDGFYPRIGSLATGSGFTLGLGYRDHRLFKSYGHLDLWGAGSIKKYWAVETRATFPELADRRLMVEGVAGLREYTEESFFGLGPDSQRDRFATFRLRQWFVTSRAGVRLAPAVMVGGSLGVLTPRTGEGTRSGLLPLLALFLQDEVPGLGSQPNYLVSTGFAEVDYREPLNARRGGWYRFNFSRYEDRNRGDWSFRRAEVDVRQFIGFFADRRVIALRGFFTTSDATDDGRGIPFYLMPTLGGNDTLRGFRNYRFRGPHAVLAQAEYRWELWSGLDAALFYDAGMVGLQRSELRLKDLEDDYGFGFRFNTNNGVVLRVDAAFGSADGKHLHIVFGGVF